MKLIVRLKNAFHIMRMSIWRSKYIIAAGGVLWCLFYIYFSNNTVPKVIHHSSSAIFAQQPNVPHSEMIELTRTLDARKFKQSSTGSEINHESGTFDVNTHSPKNLRSNKKGLLNHKITKTSSLINLPSTFAEQENSVASTTEMKTPYVPSLRLVHFDLKGAPPKISYFKSILPLIRSAGANGILMEYEDTFPFWGPISNVAAGNAYARKEIMALVEMAEKQGFTVIPLIQTFGHLEFVLKLAEYRHLREDKNIPQSVCPTNNDTLVLVKTMIDQVMSVHPNSKWLHIGCDEVYQLGQCSRCSKYDKNILFLTYVRKIAKYVIDTHKVKPIVWDDMLRHVTVAELEKYDMGKLVEPMIWVYVDDIYTFVPSSQWEKYSTIFPNVWTASAFKGAFGETVTVPDSRKHLENNRAWITVMDEQKHNFKSFRGIALTGWQRYDHFASLCELLPSALPSLLLNLYTLSQGQFTDDIFPKMQELLDCASRSHYHLDLEHDPFMWRALGVCFFPGSPVFRVTLRHYDVTKSLTKYLHSVTVHKGWMTEYNLNHNFSSPLRVDELLKDFSYYNSSLYLLQDAAVNALREVYDDYTVSEWIELNIYPYVKKMAAVWKQGAQLKKFNEWSKRPLPKLVKLPLVQTTKRATG